MHTIQPKIMIIAGPTASGKSGLALSIAQKKKAVIINADSQQIYRELPILTARPSLQEEALVPHKLYGLLPVTEVCSAGKWLTFARMEIDWALGQGILPIIVGGTGLYLKALLQGIAEIPDIDKEVRQQTINDFDQMGKEAFSQRLTYIDPEFFERLKVHDRQRLIRAYEVWLGTGKSLSWWQKQSSTPPYPEEYFTVLRVELPREALYERCDRRFTHMIEQGAIDEMRHFLTLGIPDDAPLMKSVGVRELTSYLNGDIPLNDAISAAQQATRNYAKRQLTWLRHQLPQARTVAPDAQDLA